MKYYIITEINGVKQYLRRYRINSHGYIAPTMFTTNINKAVFFSLEKVTHFYSRMGIGYAISTK